MNLVYGQCGCPLPPPTPNSPKVRYCEEHWWAEQLRLYDAGEQTDPWIIAWFERERLPYHQSKWLGIRHILAP